MALRSSAGIEVVRFARLAPDDCAPASSTVLTPTGDSPDWGPAEPAAARWTPAAGGVPPPTGGADPLARVTLTPPRATRAALRAGLLVRVRTPTAGRVKVVATAGGRRIAAGARSATRAGTVAVRLSRVTRSRAAALRGRTLRISVTVIPARGPAAKAARAVRVR